MIKLYQSAIQRLPSGPTSATTGEKFVCTGDKAEGIHSLIAAPFERMSYMPSKLPVGPQMKARFPRQESGKPEEFANACPQPAV